MRVKDLGSLGLKDPAKLKNPMSIEWIVCRQGVNSKTLMANAGFEGCVLHANDKLIAAALPELSGQKQQLPLSAAQPGARVEMDDFVKSAIAHCGRTAVFCSWANFSYFRRTYRAAIQAIQKP